MRHRIRRQRLVADDPDAAAAPTAATTVAAFAASILTAPWARRPGTAPAFAAALAAVSGGQAAPLHADGLAAILQK